MDEDMMIQRGRGLVDLIAGVTPTLDGWTNDPTDAADITDGDISTFCTTGNKIAGGAWQYCYFEWDLGTFYNIMCTGMGGSVVSAGGAYTSVELWNGSAWIQAFGNVNSVISRSNYVIGSYGSKVRMGLAGSVAATITPNIREFHVWRL